MARDFLGRGWKFPVNADSNGKVMMSEYEDDLRESIWIILGTSKGERIMRPDFGCGIHDFIFEHINIATLNMIKESVKEALILWEPRIELQNVEASTEEIDEGKLIISIDYRVRSTNNQYNLVYPFYLMEGV